MEASGFIPEGGASLRALKHPPPDAFLIDLGRLPSHGREVAILLRRQAPTRRVPLVFVGGADKSARLKELLPDATYTDWDDIGRAVRRAIERAPAEPVVPPPMAGYSGTPLPKKLGIKPGLAVLLVNAPSGFEHGLGALPSGARLLRAARPANLVLLFCSSHADLSRRFPSATARLREGGGLWVIWPKKASGVETDLNQKGVRKFCLDRGFVDYKICAVDETWSGLLFARRRAKAAKTGR
jgi:CheY-like chemotaxis protein